MKSLYKSQKLLLSITLLFFVSCSIWLGLSRKNQVEANHFLATKAQETYLAPSVSGLAGVAPVLATQNSKTKVTTLGKMVSAETEKAEPSLIEQKVAAVRQKVSKDVKYLTRSDFASFDEEQYAKEHYPYKEMASSDAVVRDAAWANYMNNHPYRKIATVDYKIIKELPKADRPDMLMLHDKMRWIDPSLGYAPTQRRFKAMKDARDELALRVAIPGVVWQERGPNNIGGRTRAIMWDPNDVTTRKVWAGGVGGGLWFNNNITSAVTSWTKVNDFWDNMAVTTIAYDPSNTNRFYVGTGEGFFNGDAQRGNGIWRTLDGGLNWAQLPATTIATFYYVNDIVVTNAGTIIAATNNGIRRSVDGGVTWLTPAGTVAASYMDLEITAAGIIIAARNNGTLQRSTDATGAAFGAAISPAAGGGRVEVACAPSDANVVYAVAENTGTGDVQWFRRSNDGGATWPTALAVPMYLEQGVCAPMGNQFPRGQSWYDFILQVSPTNANLLLAGGIDIHRSTDGGATWNCVTYWTGACRTYVHADQHGMAFRPGFPNECLFSNDGGVFYSNNVGNTGVALPAFAERNLDYNVTQYYACAMRNEAGSNYFLAGAQDNGSHQFTTAGINAITEVTGGDGMFCHIDQDNPNFQITSYVQNNYYRSSNAGVTFNAAIPSAGGGLFVNPTDYDNVGNNLYCAQAVNALFRINNITGAPAGTSNVATGAIGTTPTAIMASPHTANRVFVAGSNGNIRRIDGANVGTAPANVDIDVANTLPNGYINSINLGATDNHIIVTYANYGGNKVFQTLDGGVTWVNKTGDLPDMPIYWAQINPVNTAQVLLATEVGIWSIDNINAGGALDWGPTSTGLANTRVDMLQLRTADNFVAAATHGRGLFTANPFVIVPLSLDWLSFTGQATKGGNQLEWITANEKGTVGFEVQRSLNGLPQTFETIAQLTPKKGTGQKNYTYLDEGNQTTAYYRIREIDSDGKGQFSKVVVITHDVQFSILNVSPNPLQAVSVCEFSATEAGVTQMQIIDMLGRTMLTTEVQAVSGYNKFEFDASKLAVGTYTLILIQGKQRVIKRLVR